MTMAYFEKRQMEWINSPNNYILKNKVNRNTRIRCDSLLPSSQEILMPEALPEVLSLVLNKAIIVNHT